MIGKKIELIEMPLLDGGRFNPADQAGRVVVLSFWASWCAPCVQTMPEYLDMIQTLDSEKVRFVAINQGESPETIKACLENHDWDVTVALDADEAHADTVKELRHVVSKLGLVRK